MAAPSLPDLALAGVARRELQVILVVDCSGSMQGDKIASLNYALRSAVPAIRAAAADNPETAVRLRVVRFATGAAWHLAEPTPADDFEWLDLKAGGETHMGAALALLAETLTPEAMPGRQLPPVIVLVSDGQPTDGFEDGLAALMASTYGAKALRIAIAIGGDADQEVLSRFIGHAEFRPLQAYNAEELVNRIKWATTAPVKSISSPVIAATPVESLARQAESQHQAAGGDMVW